MAPPGVEYAGNRRVIGVVTGTRGERTGLAPASHPAVDQARVQRQAFVRAKAQALHDAGAKALDQHVGCCDQFEDEGFGFRVLEVDAQRSLATIGHGLASAGDIAVVLDQTAVEDVAATAVGDKI